eukprot:3130092-Alexandrium_andersonii.AAC.1
MLATPNIGSTMGGPMLANPPSGDEKDQVPHSESPGFGVAKTATGGARPQTICTCWAPAAVSVS